MILKIKERFSHFLVSKNESCNNDGRRSHSVPFTVSRQWIFDCCENLAKIWRKWLPSKSFADLSCFSLLFTIT